MCLGIRRYQLTDPSKSENPKSRSKNAFFQKIFFWLFLQLESSIYYAKNQVPNTFFCACYHMSKFTRDIVQKNEKGP